MSITFEKMCRTCLAADSAMLSIFENRKSGATSDGPSSIAGMLKYFTSVVISEDDGLPAKVCLACISEINRAYSFKIKCENSDTTLKQYVQQLNPSIESSDPDETVTILQVHKMECDEISLLEAPASIDGKDSIQNDEDEMFETHVKEIFREDTPKPTTEDGQTEEFVDTASDDDAKQIFIVDTVEGNDVIGHTVENVSSLLVLACSICCQTFENRSDYNEHAQICNEDNKPLRLKQPKTYRSSQKLQKKREPIKCPHCPIDFVHKKNLDKHIKKCHATEFPVIVPKNDINVDVFSETDGEEDIENSQNVVRENLASPNTERNHSTEAHGSAANNPESDDNDYTSKIKINPDLNIVKPTPAELPESNYRCERCGAGFAKAKSLTYHMKLNKCTQKQFECHICKRVFISKKSLVYHLNSHEKVFECAKCSRKFPHQGQLKEHMDVEHNGVVKNQCPCCSKAFTMLSTLKDHLRTHSGEKPFLCSVCGKGFSQSTNLKQHMMRHTKTKPFKCTQCDYSFVSKGELNAHIRKHTGDHPFVCVTCGSGFTTSSSLVKHRRIHTGERPYACEFCPMRFTALGTLKNHRRTHTGEQPFRCKHCDRAFAQKSDCVSHMRTHTGERPYICPACGLSFQQSGTMKTHFKTHLKEDMAEQSECEMEHSDTKNIEKSNVDSPLAVCQIFGTPDELKGDILHIA